MTKQLNLFQIEALKTGKDKCPHCGKNMRAYCKVLDMRLVEIGYDILYYLKHSGYQTFNPKVVFAGNHLKISDFQKLHYWGIIRRTKKAGMWEFTSRGESFFYGRITLPQRVWVFNNIKVDEEDKYVAVYEVDPRWQTSKFDFANDYAAVNNLTLPL